MTATTETTAASAATTHTFWCFWCDRAETGDFEECARRGWSRSGTVEQCPECAEQSARMARAQAGAPPSQSSAR